MLSSIVNFSIRNKLIVMLFTLFLIGFGLYSLSKIPFGAVPDITNNQVQVITTSTKLSTQDIEQFITYPVELEMANLPGVQEIRSISKFGLSVVTIVFDDDMGTYLPRQLIAEKIQSATEKIPEGFGIPQMGPITTGLGEIYQYVLDVEPEYRDLYSPADLRTIQDWTIRRQLSGIPGVVEINSWGGLLKQYEVAINTEKLSALNITASEVFTALERNNNITGGGYIEKTDQAYFIRGEGMVSSLEDIGNIVVKNENGNPIYIRDISKIGYGSAPRFGAITGNGEGEKVLGQVMMLKDADSKKVIDAVKERVTQISGSLPKGVYINPFLERSELISKTTFTITENLILGCLIVIFVVVLLLGNFRAGLVVASVIPLCLLFALSLMYLFGVDANLLSLGAIDFGIIIDGAVIIVEFTAFQITSKKEELAHLTRKGMQEEKDRITFKSTTKMMNSAVFGQLIILIVFIPILSLGGVEGKMFKPMAMTFSFALIGAMILCFTYVPVVASLFIMPAKKSGKNLSARLINWLQQLYDPTIHWALRKKKVVLATAISLLGFSFYLFSTMGGEFIPTLDEGSFVIQPVLKTGTSLSKTIETTTQIEKILLGNFPEVKQVITRIGAAEVPTDPMSMEETDVIIIMAPRSEWVSADSKDAMADKFQDVLAIIPGMGLEFTQPIEMRFNELITGVRADIAIKIFGEDLEILSKKGNEIRSLIENVEGAADISVEKIVGLPQMNVDYDRSKIARYGLNIQDLNDMVSMGFAGKTVGNVFEREKRFDLVVRLDPENRKDLDNLKQLYVDLPSGGKVPLSELANITYQKGAAKISRDDTKRRIVVGINVRNRDLQSVVDDIQKLINEHVKLPTGYTLTYGGQFENLQSAKARLLIAVPIALILIFILLYFAFQSVKEALIIYSAIPMAAIGGILLLWLRDMPFSISAGVGFIALFGIAVLNGIVMIEHFKELKKQPFASIEALIKQGTKDRLRAVLLTAAAAALGFLPMALSTNAGAEVQRPLATVVVGGLVTATLLTLIVLPVLYSIFETPKQIKLKGLLGRKKTVSLLVLGLMSAPWASAQQRPLSLGELLELAVEHNSRLKAGGLDVERSHALINSAFHFDKAQVYYMYDQNNLALNNKPLDVFGIQQDLLFPTVYFSEKKVNKALYHVAASAYEIRKKTLTREITANYYQYQFSKAKEGIYRELDSLYRNFSAMATRRFELGETNYLEKITAEAKQKQIAIRLQQARQDVAIDLNELLKRIQIGDSVQIMAEPMVKIPVQVPDIDQSQEIGHYESRIQLSKVKRQLEQQQLLPGLSFSYFQGTNSNLGENLYGYQLGVKVPLLFGGHASNIKASKIEEKMVMEESKDYTLLLESRYQVLQMELSKQQETLLYYETQGIVLSGEILKTANGSFKNGEIDFFQYLQSLENAYNIQLDYYETLNQYNQTVIHLNFLTL